MSKNFKHSLPARKALAIRADPDHLEAVWSGSSLFAMLASMLWISALITNILFVNRKRKSVQNFRLYTVFLHWAATNDKHQTSGWISSPIADSDPEFLEIDHEIISTSNLLLLLIQEGFWESLCMKYFNLFNISQGCPWKSVDRLTDHLYMTVAVDWDIKHQAKKAVIESFII